MPSLSSARRRRPPRSGALQDLAPWSIIKKILLLQFAYYLFATVLITFTAVIFGRKFESHMYLDWRTVRGDTTWGVVLAGIWLASGFLTVIPLLLLLPRSRLIPDFALTIHFLHLTATTLYTHSIPTNFLWWSLHMGSSALMILLGMWGARYRELRPITFGLGMTTSAGGPRDKSNNKTGGDAAGGLDGRNDMTGDAIAGGSGGVGIDRDGDLGDEEQGFPTRVGRGRSRRGTPGFPNLFTVGGSSDPNDDLGSYEMVERGDTSG